jgi:antitoxin ParD1/3/4
MPTRNVVLTTEQERLVQSLVTSGRYQNASEVVREGLRLIERREAEYEAQLEALRVAAGAGVAALERGDFREFTDTRSFKSYLDGLADEVLSRDTTAHH